MNTLAQDVDMADSTRASQPGVTGGGSVCHESTMSSDMTSDMTSTSGLMTGDGSLADFKLDRLLGRGKYSQVFLGRDLKTNQMVAIKRVEIFDMMDSATRQACVKEVKILQNVEHPNIVKCFRSFLADNELVIVLEWAEAGDLGQMIKERAEAVAKGQAGQFEAEWVWRMFQQVTSALRHMHERRMMHRDLKPSNIFITAEGDLKLGDLGLSRYFSSRTLQAQTTVGTPYYMSPEVVRGLPYDFSSDIWSLGCLLYELCMLRNPFYKENQSLYVLGKSIQSGTYEALPEAVPAELRQLVSSMLQPTPQSRPTIGQVADYVDQFMAAHHPAAHQRHVAAVAAQRATAHSRPGSRPGSGTAGAHPGASVSAGGALGPGAGGGLLGGVSLGGSAGGAELGVAGAGIQLAGRGASGSLPRR